MCFSSNLEFNFTLIFSSRFSKQNQVCDQIFSTKKSTTFSDFRKTYIKFTKKESLIYKKKNRYVLHQNNNGCYHQARLFTFQIILFFQPIFIITSDIFIFSIVPPFIPSQTYSLRFERFSVW